MAQVTFQMSDELNVDGAIVNLTGATAEQTLVYSVSGTTFNPTTINPVGTVVMYCGSTAPSGWLICDGGGVLATSALGLLLGTRYNTGGEFAGFVRLPDFNGRVPVAMNSATTTPPTTLVSSTNTYNHSHTATYGTNGANVSLAHTHNSSGPSAGHNHSTSAEKGNHSHGNAAGAGAAHIHNLGYKLGNVAQATSYADSNHTHGYANSNANHYHNGANQNANHGHGGTYETSLSHVHTHNNITLNVASQTTSISSHGHSTIPAMRLLFLIKT